MNYYFIFSILLYTLSLFVPTFDLVDDIYGFHCLFLGWVGILSLEPFIALAWLANILYFISLYRYKIKNKKAVGLPILALILSLCAFGIEKIPLDEGGNTSVSFGLGFILWILGLGVFPLHKIEKE